MLSEILGQNEYAVPVASHGQLLDQVPVPVLDQGTNEPGGNPGVFKMQQDAIRMAGASGVHSWATPGYGSSDIRRPRLTGAGRSATTRARSTC